MNIEERLRDRLSDGLAGIDPGPGDRLAAEQLGRRLRRRRRLAEGAAAVAVVALVAAVVALPRLGGEDDPAPAPAPPVGGSWRAGAPSPVGPRWMPVSAWTGTEALVLGGGTDSPCPPNASCVEDDPMARDGAAYDPETDSWREIAEAPVPIGYWFRSVVVGQTLVLFDGADGQWLAYDIAADSWSQLPPPPVRLADPGSLAALDGRVYVVARSGQVLTLDVAGRTWSQLPVDDLEPRLTPYAVLPTDDGIFVCGSDPDVPDDGDTPPFTIVDRWNGETWSERFPTTGTVGNQCAHWTGTRLVSNDLQTATGLDGNPPMGGRLDLETGEWTPLPNAPDIEAPHRESWSPGAAEGPLMLGWGYLYDDSDGSWTAIGRPDSKVDSQQAGIWADGSLLVFGGVDERTAYVDPSGISAETWIWTP